MKITVFALALIGVLLITVVGEVQLINSASAQASTFVTIKA